MITIFIYDDQTRSFSSTSKIKKINAYGGLAVTALGAATAGIGLARSIRDKSKFTIVYNTNSGPRQKVVRADSKNEALVNFNKSGSNQVQSARAFRLPDEDDNAKVYMDQLRKN